MLSAAAAPLSAAAAGAAAPRASSATAGHRVPASPGPPAQEPACVLAQLQEAPCVELPVPDSAALPESAGGRTVLAAAGAAAAVQPADLSSSPSPSPAAAAGRPSEPAAVAVGRRVSGGCRWWSSAPKSAASDPLVAWSDALWSPAVLL